METHSSYYSVNLWMNHMFAGCVSDLYVKTTVKQSINKPMTCTYLLEKWHWKCGQTWINDLIFYLIAYTAIQSQWRINNTQTKPTFVLYFHLLWCSAAFQVTVDILKSCLNQNISSELERQFVIKKLQEAKHPQQLSATELFDMQTL